MAFALGPTLTMGAVEALEKHGSDALKADFLAKMISGEWTGTMNLTEPHAGSDLGVMKTRAERRDDGTYRIFGQKIYITWGEHDFTDNIIHLVLARLPDAPAGTRGISLFLVPKFLVNADGSLGERNDLFCHSLEHKLGIHASPTCTMIYGDGTLRRRKGRDRLPHRRGKPRSRLHVHDDEQCPPRRRHAGCRRSAKPRPRRRSHYARERTQGKAPGWTGAGMSPIIEHPDIARTLLTMKALTQGARAIAYACAHAIDMAHTTRRRRGPPLAGARQPADPDRQGLRHRCRCRCRLAWASRCMAAWASSRRPGLPVFCATPASHRSMKAPTAFRRSTSSAASCRLSGGAHVRGLIAETEGRSHRRCARLQSRRALA